MTNFNKIHRSSDFSEGEFTSQNKDIQKLCLAIKGSINELRAIDASKNTLSWLNSLLEQTDLFDMMIAQKPGLASTLTDEINNLRAKTDGNRDPTSTDLSRVVKKEIKRLNRLTIELAHSRESPKLKKNKSVNYTISGERIRQIQQLLSICAQASTKPVLIIAKGKFVNFRFSIDDNYVSLIVPAKVKIAGTVAIAPADICLFKTLHNTPAFRCSIDRYRKFLIEAFPGRIRLCLESTDRKHSTDKVFISETTVTIKDFRDLISRALYATATTIKGKHHGYLYWGFGTDRITVTGSNPRFMASSTINMGAVTEGLFRVPKKIGQLLLLFDGDSINIEFGLKSIIFASRHQTNDGVTYKIELNKSKASQSPPSIVPLVSGATVKGERKEILDVLGKFLRYGIDEIRIAKCPPQRGSYPGKSIFDGRSRHFLCRSGTVTEWRKKVNIEYDGEPVIFRVRASDLHACISHAGEHIIIGIDKQRECVVITDNHGNYKSLIWLKTQPTGFWSHSSR